MQLDLNQLIVPPENQLAASYSSKIIGERIFRNE